MYTTTDVRDIYYNYKYLGGAKCYREYLKEYFIPYWSVTGDLLGYEMCDVQAVPSLYLDV